MTDPHVVTSPMLTGTNQLGRLADGGPFSDHWQTRTAAYRPHWTIALAAQGDSPAGRIVLAGAFRHGGAGALSRPRGTRMRNVAGQPLDRRNRAWVLEPDCSIGPSRADFR